MEHIPRCMFEKASVGQKTQFFALGNLNAPNPKASLGAWHFHDTEKEIAELVKYLLQNPGFKPQNSRFLKSQVDL